VISEELIQRYKHLLQTHGSAFWWELSLEQILSGTSYRPSEHTREGLDIMDIWLDSGLSWSCVLEPGQTADVYCEGLDQFSGWFYSSLLTSVALTGRAPYKKVFVHGFTLDENGNKMSKSLGNVISPEDVIEKKSLGVDVMRWWVAKHASSSSSVSVSNSILFACKADLDRMRNTFRFLLGQISSLEEDFKSVEYKDLVLLDKLVLYHLQQYSNAVSQHYQRMEYSKVCLSTLHFLSWLSGSYLSLTKDRLYCEAGSGQPRQSGVSTILNITRTVSSVLGPVLPHLTEEAALACPVLPSPFTHGWHSDPAWPADHHLAQVSASLEKLREELTKLEGVKLSDCLAQVTVPASVMRSLAGLPPQEVAEVLGVLSVELRAGEEEEEVVSLERSQAASCLRCRRLLALPGQELCARCQAVLANN